jgi:hypothetical protein
MSNTRLWEHVVSVLSYDPDTGVFIRKSNGNVAGTVNYKNGYRYISVKCQRYLAHRLAWFFIHKEWPPEDMDHINGKRDDNRLINLRLATRSQNLANKLSGRNTGLPKGVHFMKNRGTWNAKINNKHIGAFRSVEEAAEAYRSEAIRIFGEFARFE